MMKAFVVVALLALGAVSADESVESCYRDIDVACAPSKTNNLLPTTLPCNATYGNPHHLLRELVDYANNHITRSYEYLLLSTHYANYEKNRAGFEKLFHDLADEKWNTAINIIKQVTKRGGKMEFDTTSRFIDTNPNKLPNYEVYEMQSVAMALDIEKQLAKQAFHIHKEASPLHEDGRDPEIADYIEKKFVHEQSEQIRKLAGHLTDLSTLWTTTDKSLALYLFDEYLQKA